MHAASSFPSRIVCLTEETTEALYLLGEDWLPRYVERANAGGIERVLV